jgi:hypothetical protein
MTLPRRPRAVLRPLALVAIVLVLAGSLSGCLFVKGDTSKITLVSSRTVDGWQYDFYRDTAYPCSISGYQTFVIGRKVGTSASVAHPLWVKMRGGGAGWFSADGKPQPTAGVKTEQSFDTLMKYDDNGLMAQVRAAPEHFRVLIVSMCSHDIYGGMNTPDPHNPNKTPDGKPRPTTGLISVKAAVQYVVAHDNTRDFVLHGTSAGGAGTFNVAWGLQLQGLAPTALISDSGVVDQQWEHDVVAEGITGSAGCAKADDDRTGGVAGRIDPELVKWDNQPDLLVSRGELTVPVLHVWNHGDQNSCGNASMQCHLRDGSTVTLTAADCRHENLRRAIEASGPESTSRNMAVCVEGGDTSEPCDRHVVTAGAGLTNSDQSEGVPADFQSAILTWVRARLADD